MSEGVWDLRCAAAFVAPGAEEPKPGDTALITADQARMARQRVEEAIKQRLIYPREGYAEVNRLKQMEEAARLSDEGGVPARVAADQLKVGERAAKERRARRQREKAARRKNRRPKKRRR